MVRAGEPPTTLQPLRINEEVVGGMPAQTMTSVSEKSQQGSAMRAQHSRQQGNAETSLHPRTQKSLKQKMPSWFA
jgi:hypothetical protein